MMKRKPSDLPKMSKPKSVKKTIVINCFTGEDREVDRRKIKLVDLTDIFVEFFGSDDTHLFSDERQSLCNMRPL